MFIHADLWGVRRAVWISSMPPASAGMCKPAALEAAVELTANLGGELEALYRTRACSTWPSYVRPSATLEVMDRRKVVEQPRREKHVAGLGKPMTCIIGWRIRVSPVRPTA